MPSPINNDTQISNTSLINNATQINHNSGRRSLQGDVAQNEDLTLDYSVDELLAMASHDKFPPKKAFKIEGKIKAFTPILWFFDSQREFNIRPNHIKLTCKEKGIFFISIIQHQNLKIIIICFLCKVAYVSLRLEIFQI